MTAERRKQQDDSFSERNIDLMVGCCLGYPAPSDFSPPAVAQLAPAEKAPRPMARMPVPIVQAPLAQSSDSLLWSVQSVLPTVEEIEAELAPAARADRPKRGKR